MVTNSGLSAFVERKGSGMYRAPPPPRPALLAFFLEDLGTICHRQGVEDNINSFAPRLLQFEACFDRQQLILKHNGLELPHDAIV